jgi:kumamolisin
MAIDLKLRDPAGLAQFDTAVATRGHYLTGAQFAARFGPGAADVSSVSLTAAGLEVTAVSGNSQVVDATGTAGALTALFHTTLSTYENGSRTFFANDDPVVIPAALAPVIEGVVGLDNRAVMTPAGTRPTAQATTRPVGGLSPSRVNSAYRFGQLGATGSGVTVALWEFDGHKVDRAGYDAAPSSGEFEVEEDSEIVSAIAPAATVISISWGECEAQPSASYLTAINNAFSQAAAEGIGIYSASGDRAHATAQPPRPRRPWTSPVRASTTRASAARN